MSPIIVGGEVTSSVGMGGIEGLILGLLGADPALDVYDGYVSDSDESVKTISAPLPYAVVYFAPGRPINGRLGSNGRRAVEFQVTGVGETREQASWVANRAEGILDWSTVTLNGRPRRISRTEDAPFIRRDDVWTRPDGGPLFNDARRYSTRT